MTTLFPLDQVSNNPWQTRVIEDNAHVVSLAESIAASGLLQTPLARPHPDGKFPPGHPDVHVQLAFGHSRLAAYRLLASGAVPDMDPRDWQAMPVEIRDLTDRQMSDLAAEENTRRKNLSAIEIAAAIQKRMADFHLTQLEAGAPFGYKSQGAVANLLRLLALPEAVQASIHNGELPERAARELLLVNRLDPAQAARIAGQAMKVEERDRAEAVTQAISEFLRNKGRRLRNAPFDLNWPKQPIKVEQPVEGQPAEVRACLGCPFFFHYDRQELCAFVECYDLKAQMAVADHLRRVSTKTGIPIAAPSEKVKIVYDGHQALEGLGNYWNARERATKLVRAGLPELRLVAAKESNHSLNDIVGSEFVALAATQPAAITRWLNANGSERKALSAAAGKPAKPETPAQKSKRLAAEEREMEARRSGRAAFLKEKQDVLWLLESAAQHIGERLEVSGNALKFLLNLVHNRYTVSASMWPEFAAVEEEIWKEAQHSEDNARQHVALDVLAQTVLGFHKPQDAYVWQNALDAIENLAYEDFGVEAKKLPAIWNKPPKHKTDFNCWTCGRFASSTRLTKRDHEAGWTITLMKGGGAFDVACPDCAKQHANAAPKKAKK
jgi:ParB/RepB/Spo0J family partition protein